MKKPGLDWIRNQRTRALVIVGLVLALFVFSTIAYAAGGGGHDEPKVWESTDTYRVMNFGFLAIVLFFLLRKPIKKALGDRIEGIKEQLEDLENQKAVAEKKLAEYNSKIANLEKEASEIVTEYTRQGESAKERILEEAKKSAEKLEAQAKNNIENEFQKAREKLQTDVMREALTRAEALIKDKISTKDQERLVDEYLDKVVA